MAKNCRFPGRRDLGERLGLQHRPICFAYLRRLLAPIAVLLVLPADSPAQFIYATNNGTITVFGYTGPGGALTIPTIIDGLPVTGIGDNAFYSATSLTSVRMPDGLRKIGAYAFSQCTNLNCIRIPGTVVDWGLALLPGMSGSWAFAGCLGLTNVSIGNGVPYLPEYAFGGCSGLGSVVVPDTVVRIGSGAFAGCTSLTGLSIGTHVSTIEAGAFGGCSGLTNFIIPDSVATIATGAFRGCASLTTLRIPDSVTSLGDYALYECTGLTNVVIGNSVSRIGEFVFASCTNLIAITVNSPNLVYSSVDGVLYNKTRTVLLQCPAGKGGEYTIPGTVTSVASYAFDSCTSISAITIPYGVTNIGLWALSFCTSLRSLVIPDSVTTIQEAAFAGCTSLTNIVIGSNLSCLGDVAFTGCSNLAGVFFKGNAPSMGSSLFCNASNTVAYYLPGTTGWGPTFGDRPAMLWNPQIRTRDANFGVRNNRFGFNITGTTNIPIVVEGCTSLSIPQWASLQGYTLTNGSVYFSDPGWASHPTRCYRVRSP